MRPAVQASLIDRIPRGIVSATKLGGLATDVRVLKETNQSVARIPIPHNE